MQYQSFEHFIKNINSFKQEVLKRLENLESKNLFAPRKNDLLRAKQAKINTLLTQNILLVDNNAKTYSLKIKNNKLVVEENNGK